MMLPNGSTTDGLVEVEEPAAGQAELARIGAEMTARYAP
jgi:hypothetical protein